MISKDSARAGIAHLSNAIAEITGEWADIQVAGGDDLNEAAVVARLVGSALGDVAVLANAVQVLARWADDGCDG